VKELRSEDKDNSSDKNMDDGFNHDIKLFSLVRKEKATWWSVVFAHPETLIWSKYRRELLLSQKYQENVVGIVIDEAHCVVDWLVSAFLF
jgi:superfamily II DNA helicase RecQ